MPLDSSCPQLQAETVTLMGFMPVSRLLIADLELIKLGGRESWWAWPNQVIPSRAWALPGVRGWKCEGACGGGHMART